jgi:hypothetical protein
MAGEDMSDARFFNAPVHLLIMDTGNTENNIDATRFEHMRDLRT